MQFLYVKTLFNLKSGPLQIRKEIENVRLLSVTPKSSVSISGGGST